MKKIIGILILFLSFLCCSASASAALIWNQVDANCDSKKGFVQKQIDGIFNVCYNPQTKVEYSYDMYSFSVNGSRCGNGCDFNGRNCEVGACNVADCATTYGYTELQNGKTIHNNTKCYNPTTKLAYDWENKFYKDSKYCGKNCDFDGKNCESGNCASLPPTTTEMPVIITQKEEDILVKQNSNLQTENKYFGDTCHFDKGFIKKENGRCYNPQTEIQYEKHENKVTFWLKGDICGEDCDLDGKNCKEGICNVNNCPIEKGFTEIRQGRCYNPKNELSYDFEKFYLHSTPCGKNCDWDGKNCKEGICNIENCPKGNGYTIFHTDGNGCYNPNTRVFLSWQHDDVYNLNYLGDIGVLAKNCKLDSSFCEVKATIKIFLAEIGRFLFSMLYSGFAFFIFLGVILAFYLIYNCFKNMTKVFSKKSIILNIVNFVFNFLNVILLIIPLICAVWEHSLNYACWGILILSSMGLCYPICGILLFIQWLINKVCKKK